MNSTPVLLCFCIWLLIHLFINLFLNSLNRLYFLLYAWSYARKWEFTVSFKFVSIELYRHKTLCKFKVYNVDLTFIYCNTITTVMLANISIMSHNYHFLLRENLFTRIFWSFWSFYFSWMKKRINWFGIWVCFINVIWSSHWGIFDPPPNFSSNVEALDTLRESEINFISQGTPEKAGGPNRSGLIWERKRKCFRTL